MLIYPTVPKNKLADHIQNLERCPSGLRSWFRKSVCTSVYRGFESRPLRFIYQALHKLFIGICIFFNFLLPVFKLTSFEFFVISL